MTQQTTISGGFTGAAQTLAIGEPVSSVTAPGITALLCERGLQITRGAEILTVDTHLGLLAAADGRTARLEKISTRGERDAFKRQSHGACAFGQSYGDDKDQLAVYTAGSKAFIRFGDFLGDALLLQNLDASTRGVALLKDGSLSAGEITVPGPVPAPRLDTESALTYAAI